VEKLKALDDARFVVDPHAREQALQEALPPYLRREAHLPGGRELEAFVRLVALDTYPQSCRQWTEEVRRKCTALWAEGSSASTSEALKEVQSLTEMLPAWSETQKLWEEACRKDEEARVTEEKWREMLQRAQFAPLIDEYTKAQERGRRQVPRWAPSRDSQGRLLVEKTEAGETVQLESGPVGWVEIPRALEELREWAEQYARQKAEDNLGQARAVLERDPFRAQQWVEEARKLFLLPPEWRQALDDFTRIEVDPAVERRRRAEALRDEGLRESEVVAGWQRLKAAEELDPYVPRLSEARAQLRSRMVRHIQGVIERADMLRQAGEIGEARKIVMELWEMIRSDPELSEWNERIQQWLQQNSTA